MVLYESIIIINPTLPEDEIKKIVNKYTHMAQLYCPEVPVTVEEWGEKKLAYPLTSKGGERFMKGYYILINFRSMEDEIVEYASRLEADEQILKFICVKKGDDDDEYEDDEEYADDEEDEDDEDEPASDQEAAVHNDGTADSDANDPNDKLIDLADYIFGFGT